MKKRNDSGFSLILILIVLAVAALVGFGTYYFINQRKQAQENSDSAHLVAGYLTVVFKDGVTLQQAHDLVRAYGLGLNGFEPIAGDGEFTPVDYRGIQAGKFTEIQNKLKSYPEVVAFIDDSSDPSNNRAGPGEKWVKVTFAQSTTCKRIKAIEVSSGLGAPNQACGTASKQVTIKAPVGQEDSFVHKFKHSNLVQSASRMAAGPLAG